jgi:nucleotide-binding universal stress UspA family protein
MSLPVVVATDFSPSARVAMGHAARIASARRVPLHVVVVIDDEAVSAMASSVPLTKEDVEKQVIVRGRMLLDRELSDAGIPGAASEAHRHVSIGRPGRQIVEECERLGAGLLVVGYHGKTDRTDRGPGTVAQRCVRHAPCDVLLTRRDRPEPFKRVVVGVDFSTASMGVVGRGAEVAGASGAELVLVHAYADPFESLGYMGLGLGVEQPIPLSDYSGVLEADLEKIAGGLRSAVTGGVRTQVLLDTHYGRAIADWCNANHADLTVVGTLGKPGLRYWLLGSTAEYVLKETRSAVLAVRQPE